MKSLPIRRYLHHWTGREKGYANDYFESGVVRADWVLKDYIKIFHPEIFQKMHYCI